MMFKKLDDNTEIPVLGFGTWGIGGRVDRGGSNDEKDVEALRYGISKGITHIDTSEFYGQGHTEEVVGEAISGFDRSKLFISTKVWLENLRYDDVIKSLKDSLRRLRTDYIDLYSIHKPNPNIPLRETMEALDFLKDKGFIRFIGVSNFTVKLFEEAQSYTKNKIVANQLEYNLAVRVPKDDLEYYQRNGVLVVAYKPIARGVLSSLGIKILEELAKKYGRTIEQIALNWLISKKNVVAIPKASERIHIDQNIEALDFKIDEEDIQRLNELKLQLPVR